MKNKIFKLNIIVMIIVMLFTGCKKKEGEVTKIKKNEEIQYAESSKNDLNIITDDDFYSLEYYKFKNNESLLELYNDQINIIKNNDYATKIDMLKDDENTFEAITKIQDESLNGVYYKYVYFAKNNNEFISIYQISQNSDKSNMKEIRSQIEDMISANSDYMKVFDDYSKENDLVITDYKYNEDDSKCLVSLNASNSKTESYNGENRKVKVVEFEQFDLGPERLKLMIVARNSENKIIWSNDMGVLPKFSGDFQIDLVQGEKYYYLFNVDTITAHDIQTNEVIWSTKVNIYFPTMIETNGKLFVLNVGDASNNDREFIVYDNKTGKKIYNNNYTEFFKKNDLDDELCNIDYVSFKIKNNNIILDVTFPDEKNEKDVKIGVLKINTNDYSVKFEKNNSK